MSIVDGPVNPANGLKRRWHKHIVRAGPENFFHGPPHFWFHKGVESVRGDSRGLFNLLAMSLSTEELANKRDQLIETYSHYMADVETALERESFFDRKMTRTKKPEEDVHLRWLQRKYEKKRMWALQEMDRIGPIICLITNHLNAVIAGDASPIEDIVVPDTPPGFNQAQ